MDNFIRDIIDLFKNSRLPVQKKPLNLKETVQNVFTELKYQIGSEEIHFNNHIPEALHIESDKLRLSIIFSNFYPMPSNMQTIKKKTAKLM